MLLQFFFKVNLVIYQVYSLFSGFGVTNYIRYKFTTKHLQIKKSYIVFKTRFLLENIYAVEL